MLAEWALRKMTETAASLGWGERTKQYAKKRRNSSKARRDLEAFRARGARWERELETHRMMTTEAVFKARMDEATCERGDETK